MNRQVKNECQVEFPMFSPFESYSALVVNTLGRSAFRRYFFNHRKIMIKQYCSKVFDYVYFDLYSLSIKLNMDCLHCYENCCDGDHRSPTLKEYKELYEDKYSEIVKSIPESYRDEFDSFVNQYGMFTKYPYKLKYMNIQSKDNHCVFLFKDDEGLNKCVIHKYCLDNNISPNLFKPGSCSLFPIDVIKFKMQDEGGYFVFCSSLDTSQFTRFAVTNSENNNVIYPCLDLDVADKYNFSEDTIMPAYVYARSYVKEVFNLDCVRLIEDSGVLDHVSRLHRLFDPNKRSEK